MTFLFSLMLQINLQTALDGFSQICNLNIKNLYLAIFLYILLSILLVLFVQMCTVAKYNCLSNISFL